ncbi:MAG: porin family protein [Moorea sp. SIOASIH]|uniref:outer membrane beta-barrel protein n=1 Tax=Moorena sp. SIOASIH TaxID=2607817 RepID=UPI0013B8C0AB|nr:outer membrane beta-barrel protein [Moorena sp. SIOASIH]NEO38868.1 porin family protein [Moorena sp. SIOASIH]
MQGLLKSIFTISTLAATTIAPVLLGNSMASANPGAEDLSVKGTDASYIGVGLAAGVTSDGQGNDQNIGGNITTRLTTSKLPVSLRGDILFNEDNTAIIPSVSFDLGVAKNTNVFASVGYSFVEDDGDNTPIGNQDAWVLGVGAESQIAKDVLVYGNTKVGLNAYENSSGESVSVQVGAGYRF